MIQKLILENWRSHKHTEIEFTKGTNVIVGQMGSGKTSLMDAICFAFYGTFPSLQAKKIKLDEVIKNKPTQEQKSKVKLFFNLNDTNYSIKREIELGKGTTAEIRKEGIEIAGPQSKRVTEEVSRILQVNYELYSRAVYAEQNNIDYFLEITKSQRKQKIDELLQISKFEKAKKTLNQVTNRLKERVKEKEESKISEEEVIEIPSLEKSLREKEQEEREEEKKLETAEEKREKLKREHEEIKSKKEQYEEKTRFLTEFKAKKEYAEKQLQERSKPESSEEEARKKYEKVKQEKEETKAKKELNEKLSKEKEMLEARISLSSKKEKELSLKIAQIILPENISEIKKQKEEAIKNYQEELNSIKASISSKKESIEEVEKTIEEVNSNEKCPVCESKLTPEKKNEIIAIKREKIKKAEEENSKNEAKKEAIRKQIEELEKEIIEIKAEEKKMMQKAFYEEEIKKAVDSRKSSEEKLKEIQQELSKIEIKKDYEELVEEEQKLKKEIEYFELKKEIEKLASLIEKTAQEAEAVNYDKEKENKVSEELKKTETEIALINQKQSSLKALVDEKKKRLEGLLRIRKEAEVNKKQADYLKKQIESFYLLQNVLQNTQNRLREEFIESTNLALDNIWNKIYPYKDYKELKLQIDDSGDYLLMLRTTGNKWVSADGITSGGERSSASLALRIAFSLVLTKNLSWLVLDEPTHNLDKQAINELAATLREHLPSLVEQIFLITHETELEKASTKNIYKLERNKEAEEETRIIVEQVSD